MEFYTELRRSDRAYIVCTKGILYALNLSVKPPLPEFTHLKLLLHSCSYYVRSCSLILKYLGFLCSYVVVVMF